MARSKIAIYSALAANVAIAVAKFVAGGISRSSAMTAEASGTRSGTGGSFISGPLSSPYSSLGWGRAFPFSRVLYI